MPLLFVTWLKADWAFLPLVTCHTALQADHILDSSSTITLLWSTPRVHLMWSCLPASLPLGHTHPVTLFSFMPMNSSRPAPLIHIWTVFSGGHVSLFLVSHFFFNYFHSIRILLPALPPFLFLPQCHLCWSMSSFDYLYPVKCYVSISLKDEEATQPHALLSMCELSDQHTVTKCWHI